MQKFSFFYLVLFNIFFLFEFSDQQKYIDNNMKTQILILDSLILTLSEGYKYSWII